MRFNVTLIDPPRHPFAHFLYDVSRYIVHSIESLGHDCTLERNRCVKDATNILIGTHHVARAVEMEEILGPAKNWVVMQTEILRGGRVNETEDPRWNDVVVPLYRGARAVWDSLPENVDELRRQDIRADILRFGYHPAMNEIVPKRTRDIDFLFYGSVTPRRKVILDKLAALGYDLRVEFDTPHIYRNDLIARAEVVLTIRQSEAMTHLPQGRILYLANNSVLVGGEGGVGQEGLEDVFSWTEGDVVEHCRALRARTDLRELAATFHERFKARPMTDFLKPLVDKLDA